MDKIMERFKGDTVTLGKEVKLPQVTRQFETMGEAIEQLEKSITGLADKLSPVLRSSVPSACGKNEAETLVPFADGLRMFTEKINEQTGNIQDLLSRCEL